MAFDSAETWSHGAGRYNAQGGPLANEEGRASCHKCSPLAHALALPGYKLRALALGSAILLHGGANI